MHTRMASPQAYTFKLFPCHALQIQTVRLHSHLKSVITSNERCLSTCLLLQMFLCQRLVWCHVVSHQVHCLTGHWRKYSVWGHGALSLSFSHGPDLYCRLQHGFWYSRYMYGCRCVSLNCNIRLAYVRVIGL